MRKYLLTLITLIFIPISALAVKLTDEPELTSPATNDLFWVVDVSDTTDNAAGSTKKITRGSILQGDLSAIDGLTSAANKMIYYTGSEAAALADLTAAGRALIDDASASAQRTTLGLVIGTDVQAYSSILANTTASFLTADETKLDGIETSATADQTEEEIQDFSWNVLTGTQTGITVTYQDGTDDVDFVVGGLTTTEFSSANISQWTNNSGYITDITGDNLSALADATITGIASGELLKWSGSAWINNTLAEAGISATGHVHATTDITSGTFADARVAESNITQHEAAIDHDALTSFVANEHIDWTSTSSNFNTSGSITGTGVVDFGGATSFELPSDTNVTTNVTGEVALDTNGDASTVTTGVLQAYDGTNSLYLFGATNYPSSDNDVMVYDSGTNAVKWEAQSGSGGGISNVVEDTTPQLGGNLDLNGNVITGLEIGTDVQAYDADLAAIAGLTSAADKLPYFTGSGAAALTDLPSEARTMLADTQMTLRSAKVSLTSAEILGLHTGGNEKTIVAAQGANTIIVPSFLVAKYNYVTTAYDGIAGGDNFWIQHNGASSFVAGIETNNFVDQTSDQLRIINVGNSFGISDNPAIANTALEIKLNGAILTGDGTLDLKVWYYVIDITDLT